MTTLFPLRDFRVLFDLRWRQFKDSAVYWMRVLGYQRGGRTIMQAGYVLYLLGIGAIWLVMMWGWAYDMSVRVGAGLEFTTRGDLLRLIPIGVLIGQVWVMVGALRSTPLKLSFPDMAYVAGSPIARSIPVLLGFLRGMVTQILLYGALAALIAAVMVPNLEEAGYASLRAIGAAVPIVVLTWALAWVLGISRLAFPRLSQWRLLWVVPLLILAVGYVYPPLVLWPGQAFVLAVYGLAPVWLFPALSLVALGFVIFLG